MSRVRYRPMTPALVDVCHQAAAVLRLLKRVSDKFESVQTGGLNESNRFRKEFPRMFTFTPGSWYFLFTCESCNSKQVLFSDLSEGKSKITAVYSVNCPNCRH